MYASNGRTSTISKLSLPDQTKSKALIRYVPKHKISTQMIKSQNTFTYNLSLHIPQSRNPKQLSFFFLRDNRQQQHSSNPQPHPQPQYNTITLGSFIAPTHVLKLIVVDLQGSLLIKSQVQKAAQDSGQLDVYVVVVF